MKYVMVALWLIGVIITADLSSVERPNRLKYLILCGIYNFMFYQLIFKLYLTNA